MDVRIAEMDPKVVIFQSGGTLIAILEEAPSADLGEPDCILVKPFNIVADGTLQPWLGDLSSEEKFKIHSDKILTIAEPTDRIKELYSSLTK
jgi:hypothetical protein|tara:strand:+ start:455 stop:730 length:276 start_codon:yes stop_codon:yes gene_type:complete